MTTYRRPRKEDYTDGVSSTLDAGMPKGEKAMVEHTAGPWRSSDEGTHHAIIAASGLLVAKAQANSQIGNGIANARLIAAAPALLAALEDALALVMSRPGVAPPDFTSRWRHTIAQAKEVPTEAQT